MNNKKNCFTIKACAALMAGYTLIGFAAPNPASKEQIPGLYTSSSWISACPTGTAGLLAGCFTDGIRVGASPIGGIVNSLWAAINTTPNSTPKSVYIKKFPPGYVLSANSGQSLTYNATSIPSTSKAWCTADAISEAGLDLDCYINNNPTTGTGSNCIYNVSAWARSIVSGNTTTQRILQSAPGVGGALPLGIPIYIICIGADSTTGAPASIAGITVS